ncbi:MAG: three-Cys-motif partner protein TcmP [Acidimicrobiales bacterium]
MSDEPTDWGGFWTEVKLDVLSSYLAAFNRASQRAGSTVYLDLFAGGTSHTRKDDHRTFPGSSVRAMEVSPPFTKLVFWELERKAATLQERLVAKYPGQSNFKVVAGDCNTHLQEGLDYVSDLRWAPTFVFIDPKGLEVNWSTLSTLSQWRREAKKRKAELWILVPEPAFARMLGLTSDRGRNTPAELTRYFGCDEWIGIHQRRAAGEFSPDRARAEYVNLIRWRLEKVLGYGWTDTLQFWNTQNSPVYWMVFATDAPVGAKIMTSVQQVAREHHIPGMQSQAVALRDAKRRDAVGVSTLFDPGEPVIAPRAYEHVDPSPPPQRLSGQLAFEEGREE